MVIDSIPILGAEYLIPFKAKAWLDLNLKKALGQPVDSRDIRKHKNDVFRLTELLTGETSLVLPKGILNDMGMFLKAMESEDIDLKSMGIKGYTKDERLRLLAKCYGIDF